MDDIVQQAMAKWPNVPHCFGWLRLDARGAWRMRDERAQALGLPGERIQHPALLAFINRNYAHDTQGRWYFQNGPQRVYVDLETTPYVVQTRPAMAGSGAGSGSSLGPSPSLVWHTGEVLIAPQAAWMDDAGRLFLQQEGRVGVLDDRDLAELLPCLRVDGVEQDVADAIGTTDAADAALLQWLDGDAHLQPVLQLADTALPLQRLVQDPAQQFGFVSAPRE